MPGQDVAPGLRTADGLTTVISIAYFGLGVLGILVLIGLLVAKLFVDDPGWAIGLPVPVALLESDATILTPWGDARLGVEDMEGALRLPVSILPWWLFALVWTASAAAIGLTLLFLHHLRRIFQRARSGAPFDAINARRLRWLGFLALALAVLRALMELVASVVVRGHLISETLAVPLGLSVDGSLVIFGLVLLALAAIFRRGAELEEDQSLTV